MNPINSSRRSSIDSEARSVASEPKVSPRSGRTPTHPGRKIVPQPKVHQLAKKESVRGKSKNTDNATIEELDQILEDDALVLLNMKKDITNSQKDELLKIKMSVLTLKKEYDTLHVANNYKETQLKSVQDNYTTLCNVQQSTFSTCADVDDLTKSLQEQAEVVLEEYEAEQRTIKMISLMLRRLEKEISQCRIDTAKVTVLVDSAKHDVALTEVAVQASRQEVADQEAQLDKLNATLKARKDERDKKINVLHNLSHEGENSVARLQHSINEHTRVSENKKNIHNFPQVPLPPSFLTQTFHYFFLQPLKRTSVSSRAVGSARTSSSPAAWALLVWARKKRTSSPTWHPTDARSSLCRR